MINLVGLITVFCKDPKINYIIMSLQTEELPH